VVTSRVVTALWTAPVDATENSTVSAWVSPIATTPHRRARVTVPRVRPLYVRSQQRQRRLGALLPQQVALRGRPLLLHRSSVRSVRIFVPQIVTAHSR
jgi:hypothetical protein